MSMFTGTTDVSGILPDDYGQLIVQPVQRGSIAYQVSTLVQTSSTTCNFPVVTADPTSALYAENAEITLSDSAVTEISVTPSTVAGLTKISNQLANDSTPKAQEIVGNGIARDIAARIDAAYFGNTVANGPSGLLSLTGVSVVDTGTTVANLDPFAEAISKAEEVGRTIGAFVLSPANALLLSKLKAATASNEPLLGTSATDALDRRVLGVPVLVSPAVDATTFAWGIPADVSLVVQRGGAELDIDTSAFFSSYSTAVRGVMRVGFGHVHEAGIVRLYDAA